MSRQQLDESDEALLQAALSSSFTRLPSQPVISSALVDPVDSPSSAPVPPSLQSADVSVASSDSGDSWKAEYDRQVAAWRAEAEVARAKAERNRAEWEARRLAEEKQEADARAKQPKEKEALAGWETVSTTDDPSSSQKPATEDSAPRDRAIGEIHDTRSQTDPLPSRIESSTISEEDGSRISRHWEDVHSLASSFPSLPENVSFSSSPEMVPPPTMHEADDRISSDGKRHPTQDAGLPTARQPGTRASQPPSLTASIFGRGLTPRARVLAIISSLAINMLLPFVNGVMLGFGEIFARNVIGPFFGWKVPGVGNVGIRTPSRDKRTRENERIR